MTVLVVHNRYKESGGEDRVVDLECRLLERHGHRVIRYELDNHAVDRLGRAALALKTVWNQESYRDVQRIIRAERPAVVHVHNTLPLASPAVLHAAHSAGARVVQTLHNYRLICPNAICLRHDAPCTACVGRAVPIAAVRHACYRRSRAATAAVAAMIVVHRAARTWTRTVDRYIAPTAFARRLFVQGGLPADSIVVKPHFVDPDPGPGPARGRYALFVGRLSPEKGLTTLLTAWRQLAGQVPLKVVGDGPLATEVAEATRQIPAVEWLGRQDAKAVSTLLGDAAMLVFPSHAFETFGQVVIEAYAAGTPVVASDAGAAAELVTPGRTGLLARAGDAADLARQVKRLATSSNAAGAMRSAARAAFEARFNADANYDALMRIYGVDEPARTREAA